MGKHTASIFWVSQERSMESTLILAWLTLRLWWWKQYVPPKCDKLITLRGVTFPTPVLFTTTAVRASNPNCLYISRTKLNTFLWSVQSTSHYGIGLTPPYSVWFLYRSFFPVIRHRQQINMKRIYGNQPWHSAQIWYELKPPLCLHAPQMTISYLLVTPFIYGNVFDILTVCWETAQCSLSEFPGYCVFKNRPDPSSGLPCELSVGFRALTEACSIG